MLRALLAAFALSAACGSVAAQSTEIYQWKDANGVTHYSQSPPSSGQYQQRKISAQGNAAPKQPATAAGQAPAAAAAAASPAPAAARTGESAQCTTARANVAALAGKAPVQEVGEDGKPGRTLDDAERASQLDLANASVRAYCTTPAG